ncbi:MAG: riboflavin synthase [Planctomycetes bacterium]|nr:riboflavin synthase [Planctomycetota bacterium]
MFTGIIERTRPIQRITPVGGGARLVVLMGRDWVQELTLGESVAVNGVCLTVGGVAGETAWFDVSEETLSRTRLHDLRAGVHVNLERALKLGDRLGGHLVLGHVDGVGHFRSGVARGQQFEVTVEVPQGFETWIIPKGSITIDGISLTVATFEARLVQVAVVPFTWEHTTLSHLRPGDPVHLEGDVIGKWLLSFLERRDLVGGSPAANGPGLEELLRRAGFGGV